MHSILLSYDLFASAEVLGHKPVWASDHCTMNLHFNALLYIYHNF